MRKWQLGALAASVAMFLGTGSALAASTTISFDNATALGDGSTVYSGHITSPVKKCESFRLVNLVADGNPVDLDVGSFLGAWGLRTDPTGVSSLRAKVLKQRVGRRHHRIFCAGDTVAIPLL